MVRRLRIPGLFAATALLAVTAYWLLFTVFMAYDDEGYVLLSLANYSAHGGLYAQVYSQYGPFFYVLHDVLHRVFGYAFTNTTGRLFTLGCWLLATGGAGHLVWRQTRDAALTACTLALTFFHLWLLVSEPMHPGGLIVVLLALAAWLGAWQIETGRTTGLAVTAGLTGAALLLTKVNVGVFFLAAAGGWFVANLRSAAARRLGLLAGVMLVLLPLALMRAQLGDGWGRLFAGLSIVASLGLLGAAWRERSPVTSWRDAWRGAGALAGLGAIVALAVWWRGTPLPALLEGILLGPLRHPGVYHFAPVWLPGAAFGGGASLLLALLLFWRGNDPRLHWLLLGLRLGLVLVYGLACLEWLPFSAHKFTMTFAVPLAWIFVVRLTPAGATSPAPGVAPWLGLLLVLQYLHAFPVAGSQIAWGTFLVVPLFALGLHDTQRWFARRGRSFVPAAVGLVALAAGLGVAGRLVTLGWHRYAESRPLHLPGAENLRLPENFASTLRILSTNATAHGDLLFTLPGLNSFHGWTGLPAPTLANTTHWFSLLNAAQQAEIAAALGRSAHPVVIVQRGLLGFLGENRFSIDSPLHTYLQREFARSFSLGEYEFWIRRGRVIAPLGVAEQLQLATPQPGEPPAKLELVVTLPRRSRIARLELATLDATPRLLAQWDQAGGPLQATGLDLGGAVRTGTETAWDRPLPPIVRLSLALAAPLHFDRRNAVVYVRDATGALLAEARFTD